MSWKVRQNREGIIGPEANPPNFVIFIRIYLVLLGHRLDTLVLSSVTVHNPSSGRQNLGHYIYTLYILDLQYPSIKKLL